MGNEQSSAEQNDWGNLPFRRIKDRISCTTGARKFSCSKRRARTMVRLYLRREQRENRIFLQEGVI